MNELDFSGKHVLVVGGSSGIGNGIAQAFRARGAGVHVCGTRPAASDYKAEEGSHLDGLHYSQLDVSDPSAVELTMISEPLLALSIAWNLVAQAIRLIRLTSSTLRKPSISNSPRR